MEANLASLSIRNVALHQIRRWKQGHGPTPPKPLLAKGLSRLDGETKSFFESKIRKSIDNPQITEIAPDPFLLMKGVETPKLVNEILEDEAKLLTNSRQLAEDLVAAQKRRQGDDYLLAIATGRCESTSVLIMFMMRIQGGVEAEFPDSTHIPSLKTIKNLVMQDKGKLIRMVVFEQDGTSLRGLIEDSINNETAAAKYITRGFLGCKAVEDARDVTKNFRDIVKQLISTKVSDPVQKANISAALRAELASADQRIDVSEFKKRHIPPLFHSDFDGIASKKGLLDRTIDKDVAFVSATIGREAYQFEGDIKLEGPPDSLKKHTTWNEDRSLTIRAGLVRID